MSAAGSLRRRLITCVVFALLVASGVVYTQLDALACPSGASSATPRKNTRAYKATWEMVCRGPDGSEIDGSMPAVFFSWLGLALGTGVASWFAWRALRPLPMAEAALPAAAALGTPTDRRDERRKRKAAQHAQRTQRP